MLQLRSNQTELGLMVFTSKILCEFQKYTRKVPPSSLLKNIFSQIFSKVGFEKKRLFVRSEGVGTFRLHLFNLHKIWM